MTLKVYGPTATLDLTSEDVVWHSDVGIQGPFDYDCEDIKFSGSSCRNDLIRIFGAI